MLIGVFDFRPEDLKTSWNFVSKIFVFHRGVRSRRKAEHTHTAQKSFSQRARVLRALSIRGSLAVPRNVASLGPATSRDIGPAVRTAAERFTCWTADPAPYGSVRCTAIAATASARA